MKLNWTKELEIEVTFANGTKEKIHLKAVAGLKREKIPCLYTGSLDHDAEDSAVTVDGCQGDPQVVFVDVEEEGDRFHSYIMVFNFILMIMKMGNGLLLRLLPSGDCGDCKLEGGWRSPCPCHSRWTDLSRHSFQE